MPFAHVLAVAAESKTHLPISAWAYSIGAIAIFGFLLLFVFAFRHAGSKH